MKLKTLRTGLVLVAVMLLVCLSAFAADVSDKDGLITALNNNDDITLKANIILNEPSLFEYDENGVIISAKEGAEHWTPVDYTGTFDGGVYFISGLYVTEDNANGGLFATLDGATIKHLRIDTSLVESKEYAGLIAGKAENTSFDYCLASGSVIGKTTQVQNTAGGVVGYLGKGSTMTNTVSYATVSGANSYSSNIGGLVGYNAGEITLCASDAKVAAAAKYYDAAVGGIAGANVGTIQNCTNQGTVMGETTSPVNDVYVGGIAGLNKGVIAQVKNTGAVSVTKVEISSDSIGAAGGIVGMMVDVDMNNVSNEGAVTGHYSYNGGIVGVAVSTDGKATLSNAKNTGAVTDTYGVNGGIAGRAVAGGEGYVSTIMHFENCEATSLYGEDGIVESAQVTGTLGTASITAPTTKTIVEITAPDNQIVTNVSNISVTCSGVQTNRHSHFDGMSIIRRHHRGSTSANIETAATFVPNPVLINFTLVTEIGKMEILSVDTSNVTLASGTINGTAVIKVYNPDNTASNAVLGTSVNKQFVNAKFASVSVDEIATIEVIFNNMAIDASATAASINVMVVGSTDNMDPLCENEIVTIGA